MRVLMATPEIYGLAKTGGLGDVSAALPAALAELGAETRVLLPAYPQALDAIEGGRTVARLGDPLGGGETHLLGGRIAPGGAPARRGGRPGRGSGARGGGPGARGRAPC